MGNGRKNSGCFHILQHLGCRVASRECGRGTENAKTRVRGMLYYCYVGSTYVYIARTENETDNLK